MIEKKKIKTRLLIIIGIVMISSIAIVYVNNNYFQESEAIDIRRDVVEDNIQLDCFLVDYWNGTKCVPYDFETSTKPDLELSVDKKINFGESFTIHAWLPTYENQNDAQYMISVLDSEGNQVDSTIWFAKEDFVYLFDTTHPAYNITQSVTYSIQVEKTKELQRTGIIYKSLQLDIIYPTQENQNEN